MKVLMVNKFFFPKGGAEVVMFQERDYLLHSGEQVIDFSMHDERNRDSPYESHFVSNKDYRKGSKLSKLSPALSFIHSREAVSKIAALIDKTQPDLMHCHNVYHQITPSIISIAKSRGIPVVLTLHDFKPVCPAYLRLREGRPCSLCLDGDFRHVLRNRCAGGAIADSALLFAEAAIQRWLGSYEKVDRFLAPSQFMRDAALHRFRSEQVVLLYNGVDTAEIDASTQDDGYVLYLGRLSREKGVETLLRAHEAAGSWDLVVAGTGPLERGLQMRYPNARFVGQLSGQPLKETIRGASAIVVPSEWYENCPMSVLEAMAHGKPVVASRIGGIPELVVEGETGVLFEPGDADELQSHISRLMGDPSLRARMGAAGRVRAERQFSIEKHNANLTDTYRSLVSA
ncbi:MULTISPECIES: glycosyltransferase family 4 protein [unclassified Bradyrhizobium]|uniref:glycosyltransferase family 4 protein n=1 Tax=unclassified Bradyrhizobium TaxID=2631580 RepID=UPI001BA7F79B|nr:MULTISPECIES: glycosyltransferase family 4 protein [unclassified Bradyrhizobium]MBR1229049.1 glycosyltransferase family 4 protein [Bradyrhizobium sp. AUGA SZCCT0176]MBR1299016.1 glycosyltransferase family 4 protein [Bradyrhizobium sp. AUGA SZCCT0042]